MSVAVWNYVQYLSFSKRVTVAISCAVVFGASLTTYVMFMPGHLMQVVASCIKVPMLLLLCPLIALYPTLVLSKVFDRNIDTGSLLKAAFSCVVGMALCLALAAPGMALLNALGNYTFVIFASYVAFAIAGLAGCVAFYFKLIRVVPTLSSVKTALKISAIWSIFFGLIGAELGWSIRPFVGWTGQPFEWYRTDRTRIWDQLNAETQNLNNVGGLQFPTTLEKTGSE